MSNENELSEREREILCLVATGASNKEIAHKLVISTNTVKVHLRNVFAKIGVSSRTEATLYAIREGLVPTPIGGPVSGSGAAVETDGLLAEIHETIPHKAKLSIKGGLLVLGLVVMALLTGLLVRPLFSPIETPAAPASNPERWHVKAPMPEARSAMAVAIYNDKVYIFGGETSSGVTGTSTLYQPSTDTWTNIANKPTPVADVAAAMIGGKIYIPGGRTSSGQPTDVLEAYDPDPNRWETYAPLPEALSGYALASLEGKLYLFGGWDGKQSVASVYEYDPAQDRWQLRSPMPTAREFAGAAVVDGKIYIVGGKTAGRMLTTNEAYSPEKDRSGGSPWEKRKPLPEGRSGMGVVGLVDSLYIVGGEAATDNAIPTLTYHPQNDTWRAFDKPVETIGAFPSVVAYQNLLFVFGGKQVNSLSASTLTYQAIYTISIPIVP